MRTALKERQKTCEVAADRHPRILPSLYCPALDGFFRSFRATCFFPTNTQGSAKPPPWAKFLYAFGVLDILVLLSLPTSPESFGASVRYLMHLSPITWLRLCRAVFLCGHSVHSCIQPGDKSVASASAPRLQIFTFVDKRLDTSSLRLVVKLIESRPAKNRVTRNRIAAATNV
jgi:hypothetical protein